MEKIWKVAKPAGDDFKNQFPEINPIVLQLLHNRKIVDQKQIDEFLNPDYSEYVHDPFLFKDMAPAIDRIIKAIKNKEKILVYGDYDADGVCSTVLMVSLLKSFGIKPEVYIPFRDSEGYGLNLSAVTKIAKNGIKLIITVDCGIANIKEVDYLKLEKVDVIITDHHNPQNELPSAYAILNPKVLNQHYPFSELAGCGVAFKLAQGMLSDKTREKYPEMTFPAKGFEKWLLDLVAISTVTDLCQLLNENRVLLIFGLIVLRKTKRPGLRALFESASIQIDKLDTYNIGFQIGPRLNAAGRMDHASGSYNLLITDSYDEAIKLALDLNAKNSQRQSLTEQIYNQALEQVGAVQGQKILFAKNDAWPTGIIGLVAGRLADQFARPAIVMGKNQDGKIVGSGRSIGVFNITDALKASSEFLSHFGGHSQACGFTLKSEAEYENLKINLIKLAEKAIRDEDIKSELFIESQVKLEDINWDFYGNIEKFEPFGQGNPRPLFLARGLRIVDFQVVGQNGKHLKMMVNHHTETVRKTIGFCFGDWCQKLKIGDKVDMVFEVSVNEWNGNRELQLKIEDLKFSE